jgi:hypothetical protein
MFTANETGLEYLSRIKSGKYVREKRLRVQLQIFSFPLATEGSFARNRNHAPYCGLGRN